MLQWLFYVLVISALLSASGWLAEQALRQRKLQTRWAWAAAMTAVVLLAVFSLAGPLQAPTTNRTTWTRIQHIAPVNLPQLTLPLNSPLTSLLTSPLTSPHATPHATPHPTPAATPAAYTPGARWNAIILKTWLLLSFLMILAVAVSGANVFLRRRAWPMRLIGSHCVGITPDIGPAVVGLLRPTIAIPTWVLDRPVDQQRLILAHEASHLQARDPLLLTSALIALILMPWNVLLWWQWHRLRHAIEVDCDARVLRAGHDTHAYGETLIDVGEQRSRFVGVVAAMSETRSLLERRVEIMVTGVRKRSIYAFAALCAVATVAAAAATQIIAPEGPGNRQEISVDTRTLDRYVGKYQIAPQAILTVTREGPLLNAQMTGQVKLPIYAEAPHQFFWKSVDAQVTFALPEEGAAGSATVHQNGQDVTAPRLDDASARALEQQLADRVNGQQPQSGSEAALRKSIAAIAAGTPNYGDMEEALQDATRRQLPALEAYFKEYGPVQSVEFKGVTATGVDKYLVTHQNGKQSQCFIALDADGKISGLLMRPSF